MKKYFIALLVTIVYANSYAYDPRNKIARCDLSYQELSSQRYKTIFNIYFADGGNCPATRGYELQKLHDTLFVKAYYETRVPGVGNGCRKITDTTFDYTSTDIAYINMSVNLITYDTTNHSLTDTIERARDTTFALRSNLVNDVNFQDRTRIYPNPSDGNLTIQSDNTRENLSVQLFSITGIPILKDKVRFNPGETKLQLDLKDIPAGMYWVNLYSEGQVISRQKILKLN